MATVQWVVLKHHKKEDGTYNPKIQIIHNRTSAYISTGLHTDGVRFRKGSSIGTLIDKTVENQLNDKVKLLRNMINEKEEIVSVLGTAKEVKDYLTKKLETVNGIDFIKFAREYISTIKNESTRSYNITRINALTKYVIEHTGGESLLINKITCKFLQDYETWLRKTNRKSNKANSIGKGISNNSINSYMGAISIIFNAAKKKFNDYDNGEVVIKNDPFKSYQPPQIESTKKRAVSKDVILSIYNYHAKKKVPEMTRDLFIMSFFLAGMNLADFYYCEPFNDRVEYTRKKTRDHKKNKPFISLMIHPFIKNIVDKYRDEDCIRGFCFYKLYNNTHAFHQAIRRGIDVLRRDLKLPDLTFYVARHSFATIARNKARISKDDISVCLTHESGNSMTDTYIDIDFSIVDDVIDKVVSYIFGDNQ